MDKNTLATEDTIQEKVAIISECLGKRLPQGEFKGLKPSSLRTIELEGKWAFILFGSPAQIKAQIAVLKSVYVGEVAYCTHDLLMKEEDRKDLQKLGVTIFKKTEELFLYAKENVEKGVRCVGLTYCPTTFPASELATYDFGSLGIPFFEFKHHAFERSVHLDSIEPWMAPFLEELFSSKDYSGPFHYESTALDHDALTGVLSCAKRIDEKTIVSVPKDLVSKVFANATANVTEICEWQILSDAPVSANDIFIGEYLTDEEAYNGLSKLAKLPKKPKKAYVIVRDYSVLPFFEASISEMVGCPVKAFNALSPLYRGLMEFYEDWKKRDLFNSYICHEPGSVFPFLDRDIFTYKDKDARCFDSYIFYCPYSIYPYLEAYEGKKEKDLAGEAELPVFEAIKRGERIPAEWFYADLLRTFNDPNSLLFRFANHEHIMWSRRTCLYRNSKDFAKRLAYFKPLSKFVELLGEKANAQIVKDYYASIPFLFEVIPARKRHFDPKLDLAKKPIDLDLLVEETDVSGKQLEDIIAESEAAEIVLRPSRMIDSADLCIFAEKQGPSKTREGMMHFFSKAISAKFFPAPGDIIVEGGKPSFVILYAYDIRQEEGWVSTINDIGGLNLEIEGHRLPASIIGAASIDVLIPSSPACGSPKNLPILYGAPYCLDSAAGVLMRKRVSEALRIGEIGEKAFQTPIISRIPLKKAPFTLNFDYLSLFSYRMAFANSIDEYRGSGADVSEDIFRFVRIFKLPTVEFPYRGYDEDYKDDVLSMRSVPEIGDPDDPDNDPDEPIQPPNVLPLPYPVLHRSMLPMLACMLYLGEEDGFALGEGRLFFDKKAITEKKIAFTSDPTLGERLESALPKVFAILKDPHGEMMERALREFTHYPFGERKQRMLLYRLAKLGIFSEKAFFHSYIPVSAKALSDIFYPGTSPDIYMLSVINAGADILKIKEQGATEELRKALEKHANECFDSLLFVHLRRISKSRLIELRMDELNNKYYEVWLKCDGRENRADLTDALFGACGAWCLTQDSGAAVLIYMALFAQYVSKDKCVDLFLSDASGEFKRLEELSKKYEGLLSFDSNHVSSWRISNYCRELPKEETPATIRFALPGREEAEFEVLAATYLLRRVYLLISPKENLGYITPMSCLVLVKHQFDEGYDLETSSDNIDIIMETHGE